MDLGLRGKTALVTGGSLGIGRAIALQMAQEGADVVIVARGQERLEAARKLLEARGVRVVAISQDLSEQASADRCVNLVQAHFGKLDILINNAGYYAYGNFLELTDSDWAEGFGLKFFGYIRVTRAFWPMLREVSGAVINIIGINARAGTDAFSISGATGAALVNLTKSMALVGTRDRVRVNAVAPGIIATDRFPVRVALEAKQKAVSEEKAIEMMMLEHRVTRPGNPAEVADAVCFLASPRAAYIHGAILDLDGGLNNAV